MVQTIINTGVEYEKTSVQFAHGIRSTPTMIINGRMIISAFPFEQLQAIFQDLVDKYKGRTRFVEQWIPPKARKVKHDYVPGIYLTYTIFCGKISTRFKTLESWIKENLLSLRKLIPPYVLIIPLKHLNFQFVFY